MSSGEGTPPLTVVALGGNTLVGADERGSAAEQRANLRRAVAALEPLLADGLVLTHGNGPQVGNELLRHERAASEVPALPLFLAVAQTQAEIGSLLAAELVAALAARPVACVVTHVVVDPDDRAFAEPTKPIGPSYPEARAHELHGERGWTLVEDSGRGWRRAVPSPAPVEIVELAAIRALVAADAAVVACGGGGIPVVRRGDRLEGAEAVIDKDRPSALLAAALGARRLVVITGVPAVVRGFGRPDAEPVPWLSADEADALAPELPAGSMRPKVEACAAFARATGGEAVISSADALGDALAGRAGTRVTAD